MPCPGQWSETEENGRKLACKNDLEMFDIMAEVVFFAREIRALRRTGNREFPVCRASSGWPSPAGTIQSIAPGRASYRRNNNNIVTFCRAMKQICYLLTDWVAEKEAENGSPGNLILFATLGHWKITIGYCLSMTLF
jgi:hypothetical protein